MSQELKHSPVYIKFTVNHKLLLFSVHTSNVCVLYGLPASCLRLSRDIIVTLVTPETSRAPILGRALDCLGEDEDQDVLLRF